MQFDASINHRQGATTPLVSYNACLQGLLFTIGLKGTTHFSRGANCMDVYDVVKQLSNHSTDKQL